MISRFFFIRLLALTLPFTLGACGITDWADSHMPVIGQRCENWQCFTSGGQQQSQMNEQERQRENAHANTQDTAPTATTSTPVAAAPAAPTQPLAPAMPEEGAYKYVPRAPAAPGSSPFEGQYQPAQ